MGLAATDANLPVDVTGEDATGEQGEERRRRRRRGGRNRNRRDRENGEAIAAGSESEDAEESADGTEAVQLELTKVAAASVQAVVETAKTPASQTVSEQPAVLEAPIARTEEAAVATTQAVEEMATQSVEAPAAPKHEAVVMPAPVMEFKPASEPAPVTTLPENSMVPTPMPIERLQEVLANAGLTLATTDPEKLRAAQEATAKFVPPPHVPRERKSQPPLTTEPLIQIETRR